MKSISVGFSRPNRWKPFAWLIMKAYNIPYDHVYIRVHSDKHDRDLIYQASGIAVNFMGPAIFDSNNVIVKEFKIDIADDKYQALMQFAIDNAGKPYGIKEVVGLAWVRVMQLCGKTVKNPFKDGGATYVCCELVGHILEQFAGVDIPGSMYDWNPKDVYDFLVANYDPVK